MKKIKKKLKLFSKNDKITEFFQKNTEKSAKMTKLQFCQKNTEKSAKIQKIQRKCQNTEQILKYRVIETSVLQSNSI